MTRISPRLKWLAPYLAIGLGFISKRHKIDRIGAWSRDGSRGRNEHAAIFQNGEGEGHRIWIHTHFYDCDTLRPFSKIDILQLLAHELAHTEDWNHTPRHKKLEAKITRSFMTMLEAEGYESEEREMGPS